MTDTRKDLWPQYVDRIAGGWKCISYHMYDSEGPGQKLLATPHGDSPLGRVLISRNAYISAHMARPERMQPLPSGKQWQVGDDAEVAFVARGLSMYCGYLKLYEDEKGLYWQTKVEVCSDPGRMGGIEERRLEFVEEDGKMYVELRPKQDMIMEDGTPTRAVLRWEKFE